jgi:hypothetical protein
VGFGSGASREYKVFDPRKFDAAVCVTNLDSAAGIVMPFYDEDADLLFLAGKVRSPSSHLFVFLFV